MPEAPQSVENLGRSVAVAGEKIVVSAQFQEASGERQGTAFIFDPDSSGIWVQAKELTPNELSSSEVFGESVSVQDNTAFIGSSKFDGVSPDSGSVNVFDVATNVVTKGLTPLLIRSSSRSTVKPHLKLRSDIETIAIDDWKIYESSPAGALVAAVYDSKLKREVLQLSGDGMDNGFRLGGSNIELGGWNETGRFNLSWKML